MAYISQLFPVVNRQLQDINPLFVGRMACENGFCPGPQARNYSLIHYVLSGSGTLFHAKANTTYSVHAGQCFLMQPDQLYLYTADKNDPWDYVWVAFNGNMQKKFVTLFDTPVFDAPKHVFQEILNTFNNEQNTYHMEYYLAGQIYLLYYLLTASRSSENHYALKVKSYIDTSYMNNITVQEIANIFNLDRHYLSRIFKEKLGMPIQQYLLNVRLQKAAFLLQQHYSVTQVAEMVGYSDTSNFSRKFKKTYGISPKLYRTQKTEDSSDT